MRLEKKKKKITNLIYDKYVIAFDMWPVSINNVC